MDLAYNFVLDVYKIVEKNPKFEEKNYVAELVVFVRRALEMGILK
jgi:hypothetical protein